MGAVLGTEGRKPSAETGSRTPRPGVVVRSPKHLTKTMSGVAPAANPPLATAARPTDDDTNVDKKPPVSKGPTSIVPATKRMAAGNAPHKPRAPSIAPPAAPSVAPSAPLASAPSSMKPRSPTLPPPLPASAALPLPPSMSTTASYAPPPPAPSYAPPAMQATQPQPLPLPASFAPPPVQPSFAPPPVQPSFAPPPVQPSYAPPMMHASQPPPMMHASQPPPMPPPYAPPMMHASQPPPMYAPAPLPAPSTPKAFAPAGRASGGDDESAALTYQVYAPEALPPARPMNLSRTSFPDVAAKPRFGARFGLAIIAACVVAGTAVLIIFGTADEPRAKTAAVTAAATASAIATTDTAGAASAVAPAPVADPPAVASAPVEDPAPPAPVVKAKGSKAKGASSAGGLRGVALPPNPFSGGSATPAKPKKKKPAE